MKEDEEQRTPLRQAGTPEQMSEAALFFLTDASNITGQNIVVDAGSNLGLLPR
uniref:SDR family oxidoreductase n=1 Tax=Mesorhizobium caraganae TaxID=483206 RepID=UPI00177D868E